MRQIIKESVKAIALCLLVVISAIFTASISDSVGAKAKKIEKTNTPNGASALTEEERDEYMKYLQNLGGYVYENGVVTNKAIYTIELP